MKRHTLLAGLPAILGLLAGCGSPSSNPPPTVYSAGQVGQVVSGESGQVMAVEEVLIQASSTQAGSPGTGAQIGSAVGAGAMTGNPLAIVGAIGGIMGAKAGAGMDNQVGDKITILLDNGKTVTVVQARDKKQPIMPGERVVLEQGSSTSIYGGGNARVVREAPSKDPDYSIKPGTASGWATR